MGKYFCSGGPTIPQLIAILLAFVSHFTTNPGTGSLGKLAMIACFAAIFISFFLT